MLGVWRFPLGGGVGLVVTISLGSVKVGVGVEWWLSSGVDNKGGGVGWLVFWFWLGVGLGWLGVGWWLLG